MARGADLLALFGLNHLVVGYAGMIMTEAPFICMTLAALVLLGPAPATDAPRRRRRGGVVAVALALAVACLFRATGLALVVGAAAWLFVRGRRSDAALLVAVTAALLAPWLIFQRAVTGRWLRRLRRGRGERRAVWLAARLRADNLLAY